MLVVTVAIAIAIAAASALSLLLTEPVASTFDLGFGFGAAIADVSRGGLADGSRSPLVPYALGTLARLSDDALVASILKNLGVQAALVVALWRTVRDHRRGIAIAVVLVVLTFPPLQRASLALVPEEGWLIAWIALLFDGLLRARRGAPASAVAPYAVLLGAIVATKSSMLVLAPALAILFAVRTRRLAVLALCGGAVVAVMLGLGVANLQRGRFAIGTSLDGYNFWKGNNEHALEVFPARSLDTISHLAPSAHVPDSEWEDDLACYRAAIAWNVRNPGDALHMEGLRIWQFFGSVMAEEPPESSSRNAVLRVIGLPHMIAFRLALLVALGLALREARAPRGGASVHAERRAAARAYLVLVAAVAAPHLVAFGVQRHVMTLVMPTVSYLLWRRRAAAAERPTS